MAVGAVAEAEDDEEGDLGFGIEDITEGRGGSEVVAEGGPVVEDGGAGSDGLTYFGLVRDLHSSAEVSLEFVSGDRWSSTQGLGCG